MGYRLDRNKIMSIVTIEIPDNELEHIENVLKSTSTIDKGSSSTIEAWTLLALSKEVRNFNLSIVEQAAKDSFIDIEAIDSNSKRRKEVAETLSDILANKSICDLGTEKGGQLAAFSTYAREAKGIEISYDSYLISKARGLDVVLGDYTIDKIPVADIYYYWPYNFKILPTLVGELLVVGDLTRKESIEWITAQNPEIRVTNSGFKLYLIKLPLIR